MQHQRREYRPGSPRHGERMQGVAAQGDEHARGIAHLSWQGRDASRFEVDQIRLAAERIADSLESFLVSFQRAVAHHHHAVGAHGRNSRRQQAEREPESCQQAYHSRVWYTSFRKKDRPSPGIRSSPRSTGSE